MYRCSWRAKATETETETETREREREERERREKMYRCSSRAGARSCAVPVLCRWRLCAAGSAGRRPSLGTV